jgi:hypothetical protein
MIYDFWVRVGAGDLDGNEVRAIRQRNVIGVLLCAFPSKPSSRPFRRHRRDIIAADGIRG